MCFLRVGDIDQVGLLLKDSLQTASLLLSREGSYLEDPRWDMTQVLVESLRDKPHETLGDRVRLAAQIAKQEGEALDAIAVLPEAA